MHQAGRLILRFRVDVGDGDDVWRERHAERHFTFSTLRQNPKYFSTWAPCIADGPGHFLSYSDFPFDLEVEQSEKVPVNMHIVDRRAVDPFAEVSGAEQSDHSGMAIAGPSHAHAWTGWRVARDIAAAFLPTDKVIVESLAHSVGDILGRVSCTAAERISADAFKDVRLAAEAVGYKGAAATPHANIAPRDEPRKRAGLSMLKRSTAAAPATQRVAAARASRQWTEDDAKGDGKDDDPWWARPQDKKRTRRLPAAPPLVAAAPAPDERGDDVDVFESLLKESGDELVAIAKGYVAADGGDASAAPSATPSSTLGADADLPLGASPLSSVAVDADADFPAPKIGLASIEGPIPLSDLHYDEATGFIAVTGHAMSLGRIRWFPAGLARSEQTMVVSCNLRHAHGVRCGRMYTKRQRMDWELGDGINEALKWLAIGPTCGTEIAHSGAPKPLLVLSAS